MFSGALFAFVLPFFFIACATPPEPEIRVVSDAQDAYAAIAETVPALVVLPAASSSGVPPETLRALEDALRRQLAGGGKYKPALMGKWLAASYSRQKAAGPFTLLSSLREERFTVPLRGLCGTRVFHTGDFYGLWLSAFSLTGSPYPVSVLRFFREGEDAGEVAAACLEELYERLESPRRGEGKKRVAVEDFRLEFRKLLELESGEFEFISAPLAVRENFTLREGDDYFSLLVGHSLAGTNLFEVMRLSELSAYAEKESGGAADYVVRGRVQLSGEMNVLYAGLYAAAGGEALARVRHPFKGSGLAVVWDACREAAAAIVEAVFPRAAFGEVPPLEAPGRGFFCKGMLAGRDSLRRFLLPKGLHEIRTGSYLRPNEFAADGNEDLPRVFYVLIDKETRVFHDREGEYVWNLLKK